MANERYQVPVNNLTMKRSRSAGVIKRYYHAFHGDLIPVLVLEGLPGDNLKMWVHDYTRMSVPIAPIMSNIRKHFAAFYTPKRILWNKTKQFYGEAQTFGIAEKVTEPRAYGSSIPLKNTSWTPFFCNSDFASDATFKDEATGINPFRSFSCYMGLIAQNTNDDIDDVQPVNVLPLWAVMKCYNEHFRDQNFCDPYQWDMDLTGDFDNKNIAVLGNSPVSYCSQVPLVRKDNDIFTTFLPWAQKGDPVTLSLGDTASLVSIDDSKSDLLAFNSHTTAYQTSAWNLTAPTGTYDSGGSKAVTIDSNNYLIPKISDNVVVDLTSATAVTISQLLYAVAYQDFLQRLCKFGSKYGDYIKSIFGVSTDDSTQDIPEFLGYKSVMLNIDTVVQTTGHASGDSSELADLGGYSATRLDDSLIDYACKEPGYYCVFTYFKHERIYSAGIDQMFLKSELLDYYQTPFANIPDVPYAQALIYFNGQTDSVSTKFGFNEPFLDNRAHQDKVIGFLNPQLPGSLDYWTLADKYDNAPILGADFIEEDREAIARALTTGITGPDYICSTDFNYDWVRVMPAYSSGRIGNF